VRAAKAQWKRKEHSRSAIRTQIIANLNAVEAPQHRREDVGRRREVSMSSKISHFIAISWRFVKLKTMQMQGKRSLVWQGLKK
jgi:hypothetical protein